MREGIGVTLVILAWLAASALFYFWAWDTIWGLAAGVLVLIAVPAWAFLDRR
jgi:hypothetical protein